MAESDEGVSTVGKQSNKIKLSEVAENSEVTDVSQNEAESNIETLRREVEELRKDVKHLRLILLKFGIFTLMALLLIPFLSVKNIDGFIAMLTNKFGPKTEL